MGKRLNRACRALWLVPLGKRVNVQPSCRDFIPYIYFIWVMNDFAVYRLALKTEDFCAILMHFDVFYSPIEQGV